MRGVVVERERARQEHLVQALARRDHRQADVGHDAEVDEYRPLGVDKLFNRLRQLVNMAAAVRLDVKRLGEGDVVGVDIVRRHQPVVEEETLPDVDHLLAVVVHDGNLDGQLVLLDRA